MITILFHRSSQSCNGFTIHRIDRLSHATYLRSNQIRSSQTRFLNRFLFDPEEVRVENAEIGDVPNGPETSVGSSTSKYFVVLPKDDYRTMHASKMLGLHNGDTVRAGIVQNHPPNPWTSTSTTTATIQQPSSEDHEKLISGHLTDNASIQWIPEGTVKKAEPLKNGNPPGSLRIELHDLVRDTNPTDTVNDNSQEDDQPNHNNSVSLLLALPRPLQLGRMLPMIAQMGVQDIILVGARKVPKDYFGSHLFRHPDAMKEKLIEGLCQAGDVHLPTVRVVKSLKHFCIDELDEIFPLEEYARVITHPERRPKPKEQQQRREDNSEIHDHKASVQCKDDDEDLNNSRTAKRMRDIIFPSSSSSNRRRILLAVGPEGGWEEPNELDMLMDEYRFQHVTMGTRVLRSDCAVISLLALAHDAVSTD